jgi:exopolyphosphatase / guanosine-5'-triphosphate,3'-diphosphate pyrophosphatase
LRLAAIDVGSNASRLLITEVSATGETVIFQKLSLVRIPLRLGFDVFEHGFIPEPKVEMICKTFRAYKLLIEIYGAERHIACATSAMRDATNAEEIIKRIKYETGINLQVISGDEEAQIIYENHIAEHLAKENSYLYIDVGGGSTECSFFSNGILIFKKSFNIGTIRLLKNAVTENDWTEMKETLRAVTKGHKKVMAIGSGGNINKLFSMSKLKEGKPIALIALRDYYKNLGDLSVTQRMQQYQLREDRADVIVPALQIYTQAMRWAGAEEIFVPKIGLVDGLVHHLYETSETTLNTISK